MSDSTKEWQTIAGVGNVFLDEDGDTLEIDASDERVCFVIAGRCRSFYPGDIPEIITLLSSLIKEKQ